MCLKSSVAAPSKAAQPREWVLIRTGNFSLSYFGCGGAKLREASRTTWGYYLLSEIIGERQTHTLAHWEGGLKDA
jgi:hypothetical protein